MGDVKLTQWIHVCMIEYCMPLLNLIVFIPPYQHFTAIWSTMQLRPTKNKLLTPALTPFNNTASLSIKYSRRSAGYRPASLWPVNWCVSEISVSISPRGYSLKIREQTSLSVSACADECCKGRHFKTLLLWVEEFSFIMYIYWCFWSLLRCIRWPNIKNNNNKKQMKNCQYLSKCILIYCCF